jgi:hypothetical protein
MLHRVLWLIFINLASLREKEELKGFPPGDEQIGRLTRKKEPEPCMDQKTCRIWDRQCKMGTPFKSGEVNNVSPVWAVNRMTVSLQEVFDKMVSGFVLTTG